jgi:hypothetical protein
MIQKILSAFAKKKPAKMWLIGYDTIKCEKNNCIGERRYKRFSLLF